MDCKKTLLGSVVLKTEISPAELFTASVYFPSSSSNGRFREKVSNNIVHLNFEVSYGLAFVRSFIVSVFFLIKSSYSSDLEVNDLQIENVLKFNQ